MNLEALRGRLIVSCQAPEGDPFRDPDSMARFAHAAVSGGAAGIRACGPENVARIRAAVPVPIIGIEKAPWADGRILITPSFEAAARLRAAGADIIALDCTERGRQHGALERLRRIRAELGVPVMADVATLEEARAAERAGADLVASTLRGYTPETCHLEVFDEEFVGEWAAALRVPFAVEGRISRPEQAARAIASGAWAVVVGTAITRPEAIARRFAEAVASAARSLACRHLLGIDLGGTNTKYGVVSRTGELVAAAAAPTPAMAGRQVLLEHLKRIARAARRLARDLGVEPAALGVATAGWVDPHTGRVVYATENLPGWTGAEIAAELAPVAGLPVAVENDANALAVGERHFGAARGQADFVAITLGTGVGGGCYIGGRLNRGPHFFANGIGHMTLVFDGRPCTCGRSGCLEAYTNAAALLSYAGGRFATAEELIAAARSGDRTAREAIGVHARYLAAGLASVIQLLDTPLLILGGGLVENNPLLFEALAAELPRRVTAWKARRIRLVPSSLGYHGGVLGAAAVAFEKITGFVR